MKERVKKGKGRKREKKENKKERGEREESIARDVCPDIVPKTSELLLKQKRSSCSRVVETRRYAFRKNCHTIGRLTVFFRLENSNGLAFHFYITDQRR